MTKIIVLNYRDCVVELVPLTNDAQCQLNMGEFDAADYLTKRGYPTGDCNWMVSNEDELPIYWQNEMIPVVTL